MSTITNLEGSTPVTTAGAMAIINNNFDALNDEKIETSTLDTDTTLSANSDTKIATQKAVKAYVDAGGNVNASETQKGIVEEATDAEVAAGTATGATGAKLFVTPAKLATALTNQSLFATANITANDIRAMYATPVQVIAAPGAGKVIVVENVVGAFTYIATDYGVGGTVHLEEETSRTVLTGTILSAAQLGGTADIIGQAMGLTVAPRLSNKAVMLSNATAAFTEAGANGTLKLYIKYRIVTL